MGERMVAQSSMASASLTAARALLEVGVGRPQGGHGLVVILLADGAGADQLGVPLFVGGGLGADGLGGGHGGVGLLELGPQVRIVQADQTSPAWTFWPALRLTSTTRASSFEPMLVSCTARIVPTADSIPRPAGPGGRCHRADVLCRGAWGGAADSFSGTFAENLPASQRINTTTPAAEYQKNPREESIAANGRMEYAYAALCVGRNETERVRQPKYK